MSNQLATIGVRAEGDTDVAKQLTDLATRIRNQTLERAMNKALNPFLRSAKGLAPNRTGVLKSAITKKIKRYSSGTVLGMVGINAAITVITNGKKETPNKIAHLEELGTQPHYQPKRKVNHPGAKPHPFIGPARLANIATIQLVFEAEVAGEINKLKAKGKI